MANTPDETESEGMHSDKWLTDFTQGPTLAGAVVPH